MAKALRIPLDASLTTLSEVPYTISFVIRKRQQLDNLNELPKEKRPPESMIWYSTPEAIDDWIERVFDKKAKHTTELVIKEIEGT
jgi:hypothetical protein